MALTRITKGVIKPNENYDTHNINSTGIVTAIGLDVNGNGDISGNLSVGGILTYEDVTSIDSVGIITAQKDIHVGAGVSAVGIGTFGGLDINGDLDVDGHTNLDNVSIAGVTTFAGAIDANGDLDVDGHTELDNLNVAGVTTFNDNVHLKLNDRLYFGNSNELEIYQQGNNSFIKNNDDTFIIMQGGSATNYPMKIYGGNEFQLRHYHSNGGQNSVFTSVRGGAFTLYHAAPNTPSAEHVRLETTSTGLNFPRDIDVDGHTNLDNVSIAGITTTTDTIRIQGDNKYLTIGAGNDIGLVHTGGESFITNATGHLTHRCDVHKWENFAGSAEYLRILSGGNIGIGTNVAPHKLSVKGTISKISGTSGVQLVNIANDGSQNGYIAINQASGVERIKLHSSGVSYFNGGNVGIKSTAPRGRLDIQFDGAPSFITFGADADNPKIEFFRSTGGAPSHYATEFQEVLGDFVISTAAIANLGSHSYSEKLRIKSNGSVGIGSDNPHRELVVGNNADMAVIGGNAGIYLGTHPTGGFQNNAAIARAASNNYHISGSTPGDLCIASESGAAMIFGVSHSAGAMDTFLHVSRLRNLNYYGADYKFYIGSTETLSINSSRQVNIGNPPSSGQGSFNIKPSSGDEFFKVRDAGDFDGTLNGVAVDIRNAANNTSKDLLVRSQSLVLWQSGDEKLRITSNGNIGIGVDAPSSIIHATSNNSGIGYQFINTHTTAGFGVKIKGGGSTADRYSLRVDNAADEELFRVNANGKVGIGTYIPATLLHIDDASADPYLRIGGSGRDCGIQLSANANYTAFRADGANRLFVNAGADSIRFSIGGTSSSNEKLRIKSTGRVNIGDADINQNVDQLSVTIAAQNAVDNIARFESNAAASGTSESLVKIYKGAGYGGAVSGYITQGSDHGLKFYSANNGSLTERLRITSTGEVKVNGDGSGTGYLRVVKDRDTAYSSNGGNNQDLIVQQFSDATNTGGYSSLALQCNYTGQTGAWVAINAVRTAVGEADLTINPRNNTTGDVERVRITSGGRVGINHSTSGASTNAPLTIQNSTGSSATRVNLVNSGSSQVESTQIYSQNNDLAFVANANEAMRVKDVGTVEFKGGDQGTDALAVRSENGGASVMISNFRGVTDTGDTGRLGVGKNNNALIFMNASGSQVDTFAIGNTDSVPLVFSTHNTERLRILGSGNIEMAQNIRFVSKPNSTWSAGVVFGGNGYGGNSTNGSCVVTNGNFHIDARSGGYGMYLNWYAGTNGTYFGNGASSQAGRIDSSGNLTLSGNYPGSDLRLKENIQNISGATDTIKSLVGKTFTWKTESGLDDWKHYGFIAQEVQKVVPDLVKAIGCHYFDKDDNLINNIDPTESDEERESKGLTKSLTVNSEGVTPILVEAMKELIAKVETLEAEVASLKSS